MQIRRILRQTIFDLVYPLLGPAARTYLKQWMRARVPLRSWIVMQYPGRPLIIGA